MVTRNVFSIILQHFNDAEGEECSSQINGLAQDCSIPIANALEIDTAVLHLTINMINTMADDDLKPRSQGISIQQT